MADRQPYWTKNINKPWRSHGVRPYTMVLASGAQSMGSLKDWQSNTEIKFEKNKIFQS